MGQRFADSGAGIQELQVSYNKWTGKLTKMCVHACYAIIAGLFTVFGTSGTLLSNAFAVASLIVVFIVLGANVFLTKVVAGGLYSRIVYAEKSPDKWQKEFDEYAKTGGQWPYNDSIDCPSHILRFLNVWGVLLAAVLLILSVLNPVESGAKKADQTATNSHIANAVQQPAIPTNAPSGQ